MLSNQQLNVHELSLGAIRGILFIFNAILQFQDFSKAWKIALVDIIPKPGKGLYKPITALSSW